MKVYNMKYLFVDIRKSDEVYANHFDQSQDYSFYNIPMNMIRFNADTLIHHLQYVDEIYIVCHSGSRSKFIKDKYFSHYTRIKVSENLQFFNLKHGINQVYLKDNIHIPIRVVGSNSFNFYSVMRIIQTILGILMLLIGVYIYIQLQHDKSMKKIIIPLFILMFAGSMALFNGLTSTCSISKWLQDYLN